MDGRGVEMIARRVFHRRVFAIAGVYNVAWGMAGIAFPSWPLRVTGARGGDAAIFAALALVIGLYGVLYLDTARAPERGWLVAAVGLTGKVLAPAGGLLLVVSGDWSLATWLVFTVPGDIVWWVPFAMYLRDARPAWIAA